MFCVFMEGQSSLERIEFISVPVCHRSNCPIRNLKKICLDSSSAARHFRPIQVRSCMALLLCILLFMCHIKALLNYLLYSTREKEEI